MGVRGGRLGVKALGLVVLVSIAGIAVDRAAIGVHAVCHVDLVEASMLSEVHDAVGIVVHGFFDAGGEGGEAVEATLPGNGLIGGGRRAAAEGDATSVELVLLGVVVADAVVRGRKGELALVLVVELGMMSKGILLGHIVLIGRADGGDGGDAAGSGGGVGGGVDGGEVGRGGDGEGGEVEGELVAVAHAVLRVLVVVREGRRVGERRGRRRGGRVRGLGRARRQKASRPLLWVLLMVRRVLHLLLARVGHVVLRLRVDVHRWRRCRGGAIGSGCRSWRLGAGVDGVG